MAANMEAFRDSLITKIDSIIADLEPDQMNQAETQIQIEATVIPRHQTRQISRKTFVLGTLDVGQWQSSSPSRTSQSTSPFLSRTTTSPVAVRPSEEEQTPSSTTRSAAEGVDSAVPATASANANEGRARRKAVGGLHIGSITRTPSPEGSRQLQTDQRNFPKRRKIDDGPAKLQPSTVDKLIEGIWEQIHTPNILVIPPDISDIIRPLQPAANLSLNFTDVSRRCRILTGISRTARSIEVMMQAHWVDCFFARIDSMKEQRPDLRLHEHKKLVMTEACATFEWSEKDLRNRMGIWKGYRQIKDVAGWTALTFAGPGIYRFCKYRMGFDDDALAKLRSMQSRFEVAADTLQPQWRQTLSLVGVSTQRTYRGHPHDWVVSKKKDPVPLSWTYRHLPRPFVFEQIRTSVVDQEKWGEYDPRRFESGPFYLCTLCSKPQSELTEKNECECFADLFGPNANALCPVQVINNDDGRNNGLIACCTFDRGSPIGEFVGLVTKDLQDVDVVQGQGLAGVDYQIFQGRMGNYTRFINHSCNPNSQLEQFTWLGVQRTVVVSKGVAAGKEVTMDYSSRYWRRLDKSCLCGEPCCRYRDR
jgi:ATP-dependent RNA helicase DDX49/DBP8